MLAQNLFLMQLVAATFALQVVFQEHASRAAPFSSVGHSPFAWQTRLALVVSCSVTLPFKTVANGRVELLIEIINRNVIRDCTITIVFDAVATSSFATARLRRRFNRVCLPVDRRLFVADAGTCDKSRESMINEHSLSAFIQWREKVSASRDASRRREKQPASVNNLFDNY